ncbi:MAG: D-tyrosyl-tRNA(Tyr) deacylase [Lachnospiraceae bacterium]|nr:D-tyrosyl-tRNA(Tyr) deacylase [Lachnospiraceae bacterium]
MRFLVQRVTEASVTVEGEVIGQIGRGFLVFMGVCDTDTEAIADAMVKKLSGLRIFEDAEGKTNLSLADVGGEVLAVSQFTLYADCRHGNRPSFVRAGSPDAAERLYEYAVAKLKNDYGLSVQTGSFGADMKVRLLNDGPFTILLDSDELGKRG